MHGDTDGLGLSDGWYHFVLHGTKLCLDVEGENRRRGTKLCVWHPENKPSQVFRFDPLDEHLYCKLNGLAMDVSGGCQDDGANVITYTKSEDDNQRWEQHSIRTSAVGSSGLRTFSQCRFTSKMHGKAMGVRLVAKSGSAAP